MLTHRTPGEETVGLYPGLVVSDGDHSRVTGSITVGRTRLPVWAFIGSVIERGWDETHDYYDEDGKYEAEFGKAEASAFFHYLMQHRGEFGRLLLILADAERCNPNFRRTWWETKRHRKRVGDQLQRCLALLDAHPLGQEER